MKKKILFVMHELSVGGAERVVTNLANNLDRDKFEVHLCLFKKKGALIDSLQKDIILHDLEVKRVLKGVLRLSSLIIKLKPDVVFSSITHVNLLISLQIKFYRLILKNTLFVSREVNIPSIRARHTSHSSKLDFFYKKSIGLFDFVIAQSNFMKNDLVKSYSLNESKIQVVHNPIDIDQIENLAKCDNKTNLFAPNKLNVLAIGSLKNQKGFETLLKSVPQLDKDIHLNIVGEGPNRACLEELILKLNIKNHVTLYGFQKNPYKYMKQADLVILSSIYEGFPNVILEANACGKFVVAFECPGVNHEIIKNGLNGILVANQNISALADAINKYAPIEHNETKIINTTSRYHASIITKNYEKLFLI